MPYHKVRKDGRIVVELDSWRRSLFWLGILGFLGLTAASILSIIFGAHFIPTIYVFIQILIFPFLLFISSFFFKPIYLIFDRNTGRVYFRSGKRNFDVPFSSIIFERVRTHSATYRMRYHVVSIYAISEKPLFPGQKLTNPLEPATYYKTFLGAYNCDTQEEAEDSIEQLMRFMGALPPEPAGSSKFDNLI